jgi:hypothetical protein
VRRYVKREGLDGWGFCGRGGYKLEVWEEGYNDIIV